MADHSGDPPDPRQRVDPLGAAIFGAVAMVYWARCLPSLTCGRGAEALTLRVMGALQAAEGDDPVRVSAASEAAHGAILAHVAALALPAPDAAALTAALARAIGNTIRTYADLAAAAAVAAESASDSAPARMH